MIRLIALDLDGTTLNGKNELSKRNERALLAAMEQGVYVVPVTGRTFQKMPSCIRELPGLRYAICSNGASVYDIRQGKNIYENLLPYEVACEMMDFGDRYDCFVEVYLDGSSYCRAAQLEHLAEYPQLADYASRIHSVRIPVESLRKFIKETGREAEKLNLWARSEEEFPILWEQLLRHQKVSITTSGFGSIEINNGSCNKRDGLTHLADFLGIPREDVMAAGDHLNDGPMIEFAGESVAMGNALEELKAKAKYIAKTNEEDGVGDMIERLVLQK